MRFAFMICFLLVGSTLVSNVDSTFHSLLGGLLLGGAGNRGIHPLPGFEIFDEFFNFIHRIFGGRDNGLNLFLDNFGKGLPSVLQGSFGEDKLGKFLGPLSQIPDNADLPTLLGDKFRGKADLLSPLILLSKKFCSTSQCEKLPAEGKPGVGGVAEDFQKNFLNFLETFHHEIEGGLEGFHSDMEGLIKSLLENGIHNEIFETFSKLPDNFDPSLILGKGGSSQGGDGLFSRQDLLPLLVKLSKSKCSSGCGQS